MLNDGVYETLAEMYSRSQRHFPECIRQWCHRSRANPLTISDRCRDLSTGRRRKSTLSIRNTILYYSLATDGLGINVVRDSLAGPLLKEVRRIRARFGEPAGIYCRRFVSSHACSAVSPPSASWRESAAFALDGLCVAALGSASLVSMKGDLFAIELVRPTCR